MAGEPIIEFVGRCVRDPELNHVAGGTPVTNFSVAVTPRNKNQHTDTWDDGTTQFWDCAAWRRYAENIAATYTKGMRVWVRGRVVDDSYERDGQTIRRLKVDVDETGPDLRYATATITDNNHRGAHAAAPAGRAAAPPPPVPGAAPDPYAPPF